MTLRILLNVIFLLSAWTYNPCRSSIPNAEITTVRLTYVMPNIFFGDGKSFDTINSYIFYYKDMVMYKLSYQWDSTETFTINGSDVPKLLKTETRNQYFVQENEKNFGLFYGKHFRPCVEKMSLDSFFKSEGSNFRLCIYRNLVDSSTKIISHTNEKTVDGMSETYKYICQADTSQTVTTHFYFSTKIPDLPFSLSPEFDSAKQMKLYKIVAEIDSPCFKDFGIDPFTITISFEKSNHEFDEEAMEYLKNTKKIFILILII